MTESKMTLADALARVSVTPTEAALFLHAVAGTLSESHSELRTAFLDAASELAYAKPQESPPADTHARGSRQTVTIGKDE